MDLIVRSPPATEMGCTPIGFRPSMEETMLVLVVLHSVPRLPLVPMLLGLPPLHLIGKMVMVLVVILGGRVVTVGEMTPVISEEAPTDLVMDTDHIKIVLPCGGDRVIEISPPIPYHDNFLVVDYD
jgi:hypothetical protein